MFGYPIPCVVSFPKICIQMTVFISLVNVLCQMCGELTGGRWKCRVSPCKAIEDSMVIATVQVAGISRVL